MVRIKNYVTPDNLAEAYRVLNEKRSNAVLGGCTYLRLTSRRIDTAIDLSRLGLNYIRETEDAVEIGAMATYREIEVSKILQSLYSGILPQSVMSIVGVQFRNSATVGATVYSRYGFSDLNTALLALNAEAVLYHAGQVPLELFLERGAPKDLLEKVIIPKTDITASFKYLRNSSGDYAILNTAVSRSRGEWKIVVGARPLRAMIAKEASRYLTGSRMSVEEIDHAAKMTADELAFGANIRSSREYRRTICEVLVRRAIREVIS